MRFFSSGTTISTASSSASPSAGGGEIRITNPSLLMVMKRLLEEGKIKSYSGESRTGMDRRYYSLTEKGKEYYLQNREAYLGSLRTLKNLIQGGNSQ